MFEHQSEPVLPFRQYLARLARTLAWALGIVGVALGIGAVGYHVLGRLPWLDATLNAAMILTGMGPVDRLDSPPAKLFAIAYSLFSSLVVLAASGLLLAPWFHRVMHQLKVDVD